MSGQLLYVVDDEAPMREMIGDYLKMNGYEVRLFDGAPSFRLGLAERAPDLAILDLNMPGEDGLSLVRFLKAQSALPVIMLTATASMVDRVVGLELGADDYIAKPCELRELLARVRSVLRRAPSARESEAPVRLDAPDRPPAREVRFGTHWLNLDAQVLRNASGEEFPLAQSEFTLLKAFAENPRRVLSRERLLDLAGVRDTEPFDRAIDVRITRIRRKVEPDPAHPQVIRTVRGAGYIFSPES